MTSTKKPIISKKSIEENQELKTIDELYRDLDREIKQRDESVERQKNSLVEQMYKEGENDFEEASKFRNERELYKYKLIAYIVEKHGDKYGTFEDLEEYEYEDLVKYYKHERAIKNSFFKKLLKFFNILK